jgi:hypothetical protein
MIGVDDEQVECEFAGTFDGNFKSFEKSETCDLFSDLKRQNKA